MTVIQKLATSLGRRDEAPNQLLAQQIVSEGDKNAVKELVAHLSHKSKAIQGDCIKVIDEIGMLRPELIAEYVDEFIALLSSKNNRLRWGIMTAQAKPSLNSREKSEIFDTHISSSSKHDELADQCVSNKPFCTERMTNRIYASYTRARWKPVRIAGEEYTVSFTTKLAPKDSPLVYYYDGFIRGGKWGIVGKSVNMVSIDRAIEGAIKDYIKQIEARTNDEFFKVFFLRHITKD